MSRFKNYLEAASPSESKIDVKSLLGKNDPKLEKKWNDMRKADPVKLTSGTKAGWTGFHPHISYGKTKDDQIIHREDIAGIVELSHGGITNYMSKEDFEQLFETIIKPHLKTFDDPIFSNRKRYWKY